MTNKRKISLKTTVEGGNQDGRPASKTIQVAVIHDDQLKEYDPYEQMVGKPTTYTETLINFMKQNLGTGILAMPNAFNQSGYLLGPVVMTAVVVLSVYCKHLQLRVNYALSKKKRTACLSFKDTIAAACDEGPQFFQTLGPWLQFLTDFSLVFGAMGTGIVYFVFISSNLKEVCDEYYTPMDQRLYMVAFLVPVILMNYIQTYKFLAPVSLVTNAISFAGYGIILYYVFTNLHPLAERSAVGKLADIPLFLGTVFFVYEPVAMTIPMTRDMRQPRLFSSTLGILHVGTIAVCALYFIFGIFGYLAYGADALGSVTLNLPLRETPATIARLSQCAVIFLSHAIQNYVVFDIMWYQWLAKKFKDQKWRTPAEYGFRTVVIVIEFLLAVAVPDLDLVISLVGALGAPLAGYVVPVAIHTAHHWKDVSRRNALIMQLFTITILAVIASTVGVAATLSSIVETFE